MSDQAKAQINPNRKYWLLFGGLFVLVVLWTIYWFVAANWISNKAQAKIESYRAQGIQIETQKMAVSGWPYRFALTVEGAQIILSPEQGGAQVFVPVFRLHAMAWKLSHLIVELPEDVRIRNQADQEWIYHSTRTRASIKMTKAQISRFSLEMIAPQLNDNSDLPMYSAQNVEVHFRPGSDPESRKLYASASQPNWPNPPLRDIEQVEFQGEVFSWPTLRGGSDLSAFRVASGHIVLDQAFARTEQASVNLSGTFHLDQNGYAAGPLKIKMQRPADLIAALDQSGFDFETKKGLGIFSVLTGGVDETELSFRLKKGGIYSGPFRLTSTPLLLSSP